MEELAARARGGGRDRVPATYVAWLALRSLSSFTLTWSCGGRAEGLTCHEFEGHSHPFLVVGHLGASSLEFVYDGVGAGARRRWYNRSGKAIR